MKGSKFNENQIISILREVGAGVGVEDICRKYGLGRSTYNKWVELYGGMGVYEMKRIVMLEKELSELKKKHAKLQVENDALKELISKKLSD